MSKILDVENLVISFRTSNGKVQAVRDISFSMERGETLAIVGESGSGKSVTAKAMLGILAPNSIVEGGSIRKLFPNTRVTPYPSINIRFLNCQRTT